MDASNAAGAFACPHCGHNIDMGQMQHNLGVPYQINQYGPPDTGFGRVMGAGIGRAVSIAATLKNARMADPSVAARQKAAETE